MYSITVSNVAWPIVALSRAREGMYIMGNAGNLAARSEMWRNIIEELQDRDCVGDALPIVCHQHSGAVQYVSKPGQLSRIAPDGIHKSIFDTT